MKAGFTPEYLLNADYYKKALMKGCMLGLRDIELEDQAIFAKYSLK